MDDEVQPVLVPVLYYIPTFAISEQNYGRNPSDNCFSSTNYYYIGIIRLLSKQDCWSKEFDYMLSYLYCEWDNSWEIFYCNHTSNGDFEDSAQNELDNDKELMEIQMEGFQYDQDTNVS